ncbi:MAG TPA: cysteine synthase A [Burkholderiales bacterium]|nr:cysteine synthase A [Burkholderiales bacterium]
MRTGKRASIIDCIGDTPLVRLKRASELTGCEILGKAEFMNPGGSVKDRAALGIVRAAEKNGALRAGGIVVEGTAGNTGIGLALVGNALGYRTVIVMPDNQSQEKVDALRALGAEVRFVKPVPYRDDNHFIKVSGRLAQELNRSDPKGAIWANQFDNVANRDFHFATTGPEIWRQTGGELDGFVCAVGTGGSLAGIAAYLKKQKPRICIGLADPDGSALYNYVMHGELKLAGSSITEGIGTSRITKNFEGAPVDIAFQIPDAEAIPIVYDLIVQEGLCLGGSSGINVAGAIRLARHLGPGHTVVTLLCDSGMRYKSRLFNREYLLSKGLQPPAWVI